MEEEADKQREQQWIEQGQYPDQQEKIDRMEKAEAHIGDRMLDILQVGEIAEHPSDVEAAGPYDVEEVVVNVDEDTADGEEE